MANSSMLTWETTILEESSVIMGTRIELYIATRPFTGKKRRIWQAKPSPSTKRPVLAERSFGSIPMTTILTLSSQVHPTLIVEMESDSSS